MANSLSVTNPTEDQAQKMTTVSTVFNTFKAAIAGALVGADAVSAAGSGNIDLTNSQATNHSIEFTGARTATGEVRIPASGGAARQITIFNNTTGGYALTVKISGSGGTTVAIPAGFRQLIEHDGTNVFPLGGLMTASGLFIPRVAVRRTTDQSANSGAVTVVLFDSEIADPYNMHSTSSNTSRIVFNKAGLSAGLANIRISANATGQREVFVFKNGDQNDRGGDELINAVGGGEPTIMQVPWELSVAVGDYAEVGVYHNAGSTLQIQAAGGLPRFSGHWVAD